MSKEIIKKLKKELLNKEFSFLELDNYMSENGYYSVFDDGVTENIKSDLNVAYTSKVTNEAEILISFEITIDNGEDEGIEAFYLKVIDIDAM